MKKASAAGSIASTVLNAFIILFGMVFWLAVMVMPIVIIARGFELGGIWMPVGLVVGIPWLVAVLWYGDRSHKKGELTEWKELAGNPSYKPSTTEIEHEVAGMKPEQIRKLAHRRIAEFRRELGRK